MSSGIGYAVGLIFRGVGNLALSRRKRGERTRRSFYGTGDSRGGVAATIQRIMVVWLVIVLMAEANPAQASICDTAEFFEQCPTSDPIFAKIVSDFKVRKDGVLINASALTCISPISALPIAAYSDELVLFQALRAIYYMDLGRSNHLPWTRKSLYDWLKEKVGGFQISTTHSDDHWGGPMFLSKGDTANYFVIRAKNDFTREFQRKWAAGPWRYRHSGHAHDA